MTGFDPAPSPNSAPQKEPPSVEPAPPAHPATKVAVVGLGVGGAHVDGFQRLPEAFDVVVVADLDLERVRFVTDWIGCEGVATLEEVCARPDVDVVALATPPHLHLAQIQQVLRSGKHVICEKPLVGSVADVDTLIDAERVAGRWVMPIFQYRYGRGLQKLRWLVDQGVTGRCHTVNIEVSWRRRADYYAVAWRGKLATELGGVVLSHALHALDMVTYTLGPPAKVFARTSTRVNDIETEDCASLSIELASGAFVTLSATLGSPEEITRHRFAFEHLTAESNTNPYENHREPWTFVADGAAHDQNIDRTLAAFVPEAELYKGQFARLSTAIATGAPPPVTLGDARASLELVTAAYWSARQGVDVTLPIQPDHPFYGGWR